MMLAWRPVFLWTDVLFWIVLALAGWGLMHLLRDPMERQKLGRIFVRPAQVLAVTLLACYLVVALTDSIHFQKALPGTAATGQQYQPEVLSLLDLWCGRLRTGAERSYSAPFALHALDLSTTTTPDGRTIRFYPRLRAAGLGIQTSHERTLDIIRRVMVGLFQGLIVSAVVFSLVALRRRSPLSSAEIAVVMSVGGVATVVAVTAHLAGNYHVFGTDQVGIDVLYKTLKSVRTGVLIGTLTTLTLLPLAVVLGTLAGYYGGWVDDAIQYLYTTVSSVPSVLLISAAVLSLDLYSAKHSAAFQSGLQRSDLRLLSLCIILGLTSWTGLCRLLRGETLKLREADYVQAAVVLGQTRWKIIRRHILPNVAHLVLITVVLDFSSLVLAEAVLTYVGVGVDPATFSWGNMIDSARLELARSPIVWWDLAAACLMMSVLVLAANVLADGIRDAFDPRIRRGP